ncbi:MAG: acyl-CoA dehydrogenase family protein [Myxococcota bacterium]
MIHTHEVLNQSVLPPEIDGYATDVPLVEAVTRYGGGWATDTLSSLGTVALSHEGAELSRQANRNKPVLRTFDRFGHRIDEVEFHPAYHQLMSIGKEHGVHSLSWVNRGREGAFVARSAMHYLYVQLEAGVACPMTMTHAVVPSLAHSPEVAEAWVPQILKNAYDAPLAPAGQKKGVTFGMAMTEKQGGSDVRANTTVAKPAADGAFELWGHKWFCSAPMSDAFLTLAQGPEGLTCFLVPRIRPDGSRNPFFIQRLKDKVGNWSNASSEIEYRGTWAQRVGVPGRGVPTIIEMVAQTRLDVAVGAAGLMRQGHRLALHHARHRAAFGKKLIDQPLMQNVLADLALEVEAATALALRLAAAFDRSETNLEEAAFARAAMPITKYWLAKRVIGFTAECLECHGGNGYVEDFPLAQLYREAPLGSIWEGSGNVQCLDVLRAMQRSPGSLAAVQAELVGHQGKDARLDRLLGAIQRELADPGTLEVRARRVVERMALALQAGLLIDHAPTGVSEAFLAARLDDGGLMYGNLPAGTDFEAILARA